jgi:hypothetical protein
MTDITRAVAFVGVTLITNGAVPIVHTQGEWEIARECHRVVGA